jgi:O-phospho-L-seryl-tRNASec:L-selenocysteinyl-tRNA synthase
MVPVGGSFIFCNDPNILDKSIVAFYIVSSKYPGRANGSPIVDMFITLLSMGKSTLKDLKKERKVNFEQMKKLGTAFAEKYKCKILESPGNTISIGMQLSFLEC